MKNVSNKKFWNLVMTQAHVEPPTIPLIKSKHNNNPEKYSVKIKFCIHPTSYISDLYEFNMDLFDNGEPEEFLLFVRNFVMNLTTSWMMAMGVKIQYLCTLFRGEALFQFELLSASVEGANTLTTETNILGLASYFYLWIFCRNKSV